jgi:hypothetical protein
VRYLLAIAVGCVGLIAQPGVTWQPASGPAAQRFALELDACRLAHASGKPDKCRLFGRIQVVDSFPDVRIQQVSAFPDIRVQWVESFPDRPGRWQRVESFPDYRVQFVDAFPDYKIQVVESFPGCD